MEVMFSIFDVCISCCISNSSNILLDLCIFTFFIIPLPSLRIKIILRQTVWTPPEVLNRIFLFWAVEETVVLFLTSLYVSLHCDHLWKLQCRGLQSCSSWPTILFRGFPASANKWVIDRFLINLMTFWVGDLMIWIRCAKTGKDAGKWVTRKRAEDLCSNDIISVWDRPVQPSSDHDTQPSRTALPHFHFLPMRNHI